MPDSDSDVDVWDIQVFFREGQVFRVVFCILGASLPDGDRCRVQVGTRRRQLRRRHLLGSIKPWAVGGDNACRNQLLLVCDMDGGLGGTMAVTLGMGGLVTWRRGCFNDRYIHSAENLDYSLSLPGCHP